VDLGIERPAAAAASPAPGAAMHAQGGLALRVAAGLPVDLVAVADLQQALRVRLDRGELLGHGTASRRNGEQPREATRARAWPPGTLEMAVRRVALAPAPGGRQDVPRDETGTRPRTGRLGLPDRAGVRPRWCGVRLRGRPAVGRGPARWAGLAAGRRRPDAGRGGAARPAALPRPV